MARVCTPARRPTRSSTCCKAARACSGSRSAGCGRRSRARWLTCPPTRAKRPTVRPAPTSSPAAGHAESASLEGSPFLRHASYRGLLCQLPSRSATCASRTLTSRRWTASASTSSRVSSSGYLARTGRARQPRSRCPRHKMLLPRIGIQLQASSFFERLTAREQIRTFASLYGVPAKNADDMLGTVGLTDQGGLRTEKLSGGQARRLSIACALVHDPELLFLDEPTGALDPQARRNLWDLLREISSSGRTVVLTTHHMDEAESLCDRVAIMDHGKILRAGPPAALVRELDQPVRISVQSGLISRDDAAKLAGMATDDGVSLTIATCDAAPVLAGLARADALAGLRVQGATLEAAFLSLTGREYRAWQAGGLLVRAS